MTTDTITPAALAGARADTGRTTLTAAQADYIAQIAAEYGAVEIAQEDTNGRVYVSPPLELRADGGMWVGEDGALHLYANPAARARAKARAKAVDEVVGALIPDYQEDR